MRGLRICVLLYFYESLVTVTRMRVITASRVMIGECFVTDMPRSLSLELPITGTHIQIGITIADFTARRHR